MNNTLDTSVKILLRAVNHTVDVLISTTLIVFILIFLNPVLFDGSIESVLVEYLVYMGAFAFLKFMYYFTFELVFNKTPGKFITQTQVINESNLKPSASKIALRTICRAIPFNELSVFGLKGRTFHDTISHTNVELSKFVPVQLKIKKNVNIIFTLISFTLIIPIIGVLVWAFTSNIVSGENISIPKTMPQGLRLTSIESLEYNDTDFTVMKFGSDDRQLITSWIIAGFDYDPDNVCNYMTPTSLQGYGYETTADTLICEPIAVNTDRNDNDWKSIYKITNTNSSNPDNVKVPDYYLYDPPHRLNIQIAKGQFTQEEIIKMYQDGYTKTNFNTLQESLE